MTISVDCDKCGGTFKVQDKRAGKQVYCKLCNAVVRVPRTIVETRSSEPSLTESSDAALSATHEDEPDDVVAIAPLPRLTSYESQPIRTLRSGRKRSTNGSWPLSGGATAGLVIAVVLGLMIIGSQIHPLVGTISLLIVFAAVVMGIIAGFGLVLVGGIGLIVVAFEEDTNCGLLYLFLPGYSLYYLITRWDNTLYPKLAAGGMLLLVGGPLLLFGVTALLGAL